MITPDFFTSKIESVDMNSIIGKSIELNQDEIVELNRDQLWDGKDALGNDITPSYLDDPYFKTKEAAAAYMRWKQKITPNPDRKPETPNMYINGSFYKSLKLDPGTEDFSIKTDSPLGRKIDQKFDNLEGLTDDSIQLAGEIIKEDLQNLFSEEIQK